MEQLKFWRRQDTVGYLVLVIAYWIVYAAFTLYAPIQQAVARYGITPAQGNLLRVTLLIPMLFTWLASIYAVARFRKYVRFLKGSAEESGFRKVAIGLLFLFLVLIIPGLFSLYASYDLQSLSVTQTTTILRNYTTIILYFLAFWHLFQGARELTMTVNIDPVWRRRVYQGIAAGMVIISTIYVWAIFHNDIRTVPGEADIAATYYLPDWLIVLTIILPYLLIWIIAGLTIANVRYYAKHVHGSVYRQAFKWVMYGLSTNLFLIVLLQLLTQSGTALGHASLKALLGIIYLLLIIIAVGYLLLARGAKNLSAIEQA